MSALPESPEILVQQNQKINVQQDLPMKVEIVDTHKKEIVDEFTAQPGLQVIAIKQKLAAKSKVTDVLRFRLTIQQANQKDIVLKDNMDLLAQIPTDSLNSNKVTINLKILGPQLSYKLMFFFEYLGPLLTIPLFMIIRGDNAFHVKLACFMGFAHYLKRELESEFVHIFSNASVPVTGSIKNFVHYWFLYGTLVVGEVVFFPGEPWPMAVYYIIAILWVLCEYYNLQCHIILRNLRLDAEGKVNQYARGIPSGCGFDLTICANYMWEITGWILYTVMTKSWMSLVFTLFGAWIMRVWAIGKKKKLTEAYKSDPELCKNLKRRGNIFPFL